MNWSLKAWVYAVLTKYKLKFYVRKNVIKWNLYYSSVKVECVYALITLKAKGHSTRVFYFSIKKRTIDLTCLSLCAGKLGCPWLIKGSSGSKLFMKIIYLKSAVFYDAYSAFIVIRIEFCSHFFCSHEHRKANNHEFF